MKRMICNNVVGALERIMLNNTERYQEDFDLDRMYIERAAKFEPRTLLWMSRTNGTYCLDENRVFTKGTPAHYTWTYYYRTNYDLEDIVAFAVDIIGIKDGNVQGRIYKLDYPSHCRRVLKESVPASKRLIHYAGGDVYVPVKEPLTMLPHGKYGEYIYNEIIPDDPEALKTVLMQESYMRNNLY